MSSTSNNFAYYQDIYYKSSMTSDKILQKNKNNKSNSREKLREVNFEAIEQKRPNSNLFNKNGQMNWTKQHQVVHLFLLFHEDLLALSVR